LESDQLLVNVLMSEDFHTFDLPIIANSGKPAWGFQSFKEGHSSSLEALFTNTALRTIM